MPDDREKLRAILQELHAQLESTHALDPELRAQLHGTMDEIHALLKASAEPMPQAHRETIISRVNDAAQHFEVSHPMLAGTLERLLNTLSQMGI